MKTFSRSQDRQLAQALKLTYAAFRQGNFAQAELEAEKALALDYQDKEVLSALKCALFWKERVQKSKNWPSEEAGDFLLSEYQGFLHRFLARLDTPLEEGLYAIKQFVFSQAVTCYQAAQEGSASIAPLTIKTAKAYKGCGDYDRAIFLLEDYLLAQKDDAQALAELADCYEMVNETKKAKLFFREAFFLNAQKVDLDFLQSKMIGNLKDALNDKNDSLPATKEWIPVYAVIQGIFHVKRELKPLEVGQLKQSIFSLKYELRENPKQRNLLLPRLLNRYFWLIDHLISIKEQRSKIEEVFLDIKLLDEKIFELYTH